MSISDVANAAANEIADQFKTGFFDDRMVNHVSVIIQKHIASLGVDCANICRVEEEAYKQKRINTTDFAQKNLFSESQITAARIRREIQKKFGMKDE